MELFQEPIDNLKLVEFCISSRYLPESEEKQLLFTSALLSLGKEYILRNSRYIIELVVQNYSIITPVCLQSLAENVPLRDSSAVELQLLLLLKSEETKKFLLIVDQNMTDSKNLMVQAALKLRDVQTTSSDSE